MQLKYSSQLLSINHQYQLAIKTGIFLACSAVLLCDISASARVQLHHIRTVTLLGKHKANDTSDVSPLFGRCWLGSTYSNSSREFKILQFTIDSSNVL